MLSLKKLTHIQILRELANGGALLLRHRIALEILAQHSRLLLLVRQIDGLERDGQLPIAALLPHIQQRTPAAVLARIIEGPICSV